MAFFQKLMRVRKGMREGWVNFCAEIGVNPDAISKPFLDGISVAMSPTEAAWEALEADSESNLPDPETIAARELQGLLEGWRERFD